VGENICWLIIRQRTDNWKAEKLNSPIINEPIKKWANELNRNFSKGRNLNGQKTHEKMFFPSFFLLKSDHFIERLGHGKGLKKH
jgi:hypothetical protein